MAKPKYDKQTKTYTVRANYTTISGTHEQKYRSGFKTEKEASAWEEKTRNEMSCLTTPNMKMSELLKDFIFYKSSIDKLDEATIADYEYYIGQVIEALGDPAIIKVNENHIQKIINENLDKTRKCKFFKQTLNPYFKFARKKRIILENPIDFVNFPKYKAKETAHLTFEELRILLSHAKKNDPEIYAPLYLLSYFELRPSEARALTDDDLNESLSISKSVSLIARKGKRKDSEGETKTKKSKRALPLFDGALDEIYYYKKTNNIESPHVCCIADGTRITYDRLNNGLNKAIAQINKEKPVITKITLYGLRHTGAQILKSLKVADQFTLSDIMGNSPQVLSKTYLHTDNELNKTVFDALSQKIKSADKTEIVKPINKNEIIKAVDAPFKSIADLVFKYCNKIANVNKN